MNPEATIALVYADVETATTKFVDAKLETTIVISHMETKNTTATIGMDLEASTATTANAEPEVTVAVCVKKEKAADTVTAIDSEIVAAADDMGTRTP